MNKLGEIFVELDTFGISIVKRKDLVKKLNEDIRTMKQMLIILLFENHLT